MAVPAMGPYSAVACTHANNKSEAITSKIASLFRFE